MPKTLIACAKLQILDSEKELIKKSIDKIESSFRYILDIKGKVITIFESQENLNFMKNLFEGFSLMKSIEISDFLDKVAYYQPILQFVLEDEEARIFRTERYCFLGSIDDWIYLDSSDQLEFLAKKFIKHLGKESFYELS